MLSFRDFKKRYNDPLKASMKYRKAMLRFGGNIITTSDYVAAGVLAASVVGLRLLPIVRRHTPRIGENEYDLRSGSFYTRELLDVPIDVDDPSAEYVLPTSKHARAHEGVVDLSTVPECNSLPPFLEAMIPDVPLLLGMFLSGRLRHYENNTFDKLRLPIIREALRNYDFFRRMFEKITELRTGPYAALVARFQLHISEPFGVYQECTLPVYIYGIDGSDMRLPCMYLSQMPLFDRIYPTDINFPGGMNFHKTFMKRVAGNHERFCSETLPDNDVPVDYELVQFIMDDSKEVCLVAWSVAPNSPHQFGLVKEHREKKLLFWNPWGYFTPGLTQCPMPAFTRQVIQTTLDFTKTKRGGYFETFDVVSSFGDQETEGACAAITLTRALFMLYKTRANRTIDDPASRESYRPYLARPVPCAFALFTSRIIQILSTISLDKDIKDFREISKDKVNILSAEEVAANKELATQINEIMTSSKGFIVHIREQVRDQQTFELVFEGCSDESTLESLENLIRKRWVLTKLKFENATFTTPEVLTQAITAVVRLVGESVLDKLVIEPMFTIGAEKVESDDANVEEHSRVMFEKISTAIDLITRGIRTRTLCYRDYIHSYFLTSLILPRIVTNLIQQGKRSPLETLDIQCSMGDMNVMSIARLIASDPFHLRNILLPHNNISSAGAIILAEVISSNTHLAFLDVSGNNIGSIGATPLTNVITECTACSIQRISFEDNPIADPHYTYTDNSNATPQKMSMLRSIFASM